MQAILEFPLAAQEVRQPIVPPLLVAPVLLPGPGGLGGQQLDLGLHFDAVGLEPGSDLLVEPGLLQALVFVERLHEQPADHALAAPAHADRHAERPRGHQAVRVLAVKDAYAAADGAVERRHRRRAGHVLPGRREGRHGLGHGADPRGQEIDGEGGLLGVLAHWAPPS